MRLFFKLQETRCKKCDLFWHFCSYLCRKNIEKKNEKQRRKTAKNVPYFLRNHQQQHKEWFSYFLQDERETKKHTLFK